MRQEIIHYKSGTAELRDCLSHCWWQFLHMALPKITVIPVPNLGTRVYDFLNRFPEINGIILTGGDDWGKFPLRDETETIIFQKAKQNNWPLLGICRGAQLINKFFGGKCLPCANNSHVNMHHILQISENSPFSDKLVSVNSYHNNIIYKNLLGEKLIPWAFTAEDNVEGFSDTQGLSHGIMWHPEREETPAIHDIELFKKIFEKDQNRRNQQ